MPSRPAPETFEELVELLAAEGEPRLSAYLRQGARVVRMEAPRLELSFDEHMPADLSGKLSDALLRITGRRWAISLTHGSSEPTLADKARMERERAVQDAAKDETVRAVLETFPGAKVVEVVPRRSGAGS